MISEEPAARLKGGVGRARATPFLLPLLAALFACLPSLASAERSFCLPEPGAPALVLSAGRILEGPDRRVIWEASRGEPTGIACAPGAAVVSVAKETRGSIVWLARSDAGWRVVAETELKGIPRSLRLIRGRAAALLTTKRDVRLVVQDGPDARPVQRELVSPPSCLTAIPGEDLLLVGAGSRIMTFRAESAGTWLVYDFEDEITACEARLGARGLLVAHGPRLVLVDPADPAQRGRLPVRAETTFDAPVTEIAWTGAGEVAAVRLAGPDRIVYVRGSDLEALGAIALRDARPGIEPLAAGWVLWSTGSGTLAEHRLDDAALAQARPLAPLPRRIPEQVSGESAATPAATPDAARPQAAAERTAEPLEETPAAAPSAERPRAVVRRLPPETPTEVSLPQGATPAPSAEERDEAKAPPRTAPETKAEPPVDTAEKIAPLPAEPAPAAPTVATAPVVVPPPPPAEPPTRPEPEPGEAPAERTRADAPRAQPVPPATEPATLVPRPSVPATRERPAAPPEPSEDASLARPEPAVADAPAGDPREAERSAPTQPLPRTIPGGAIAGAIAGRADLVAELVILGPNSVLAEYRRIAPERIGDRTLFRLDGVPAGSYRVLPMGRDGASLLSRPAFQSVEVTAESGGRANFEILRALP